MNARELLEQSPVMPVIVIQDIDTAVDLARALVDGGVRSLEITLRSDAALEAIRLISQAVPEALVGVGTVRSARQLESAINAGARFGVSPGFTPDIARAARQTGIPFLPGVATATEAMLAADEGCTAQKLFPAQAVGGTALLKALYGPLPDIVFCPTGGINAANARSYLDLPNVKCVGGSWLTPEAAVAGRQWGAITELARQACAL
ncbi:bifunctional 4-hydroxy-2-oxoglutarate aldolase/2-dehydro-3-deoxy-phosphogluconate aldolase [Parapusillimonas granuli]|uniref:2-dehydro-3-deoxy-phosphogluconate aldolase n=1 Tax=Parapusillimonas granuli TaxID=380911 RepID=A0A853FWC7_9BURK|nr:bifunctional 4-hydroxy-2-oxoglutarate aldolase/2-dehydro-3-deoxy-phosphogluconate aldolase [Parapusillimonas granuli]MBB5213619.1 2-dehydro-3-deoxyphosphogluconate aldolase/(4S)-4-hydroxy-2-oxoglutarate aldolase [Parapusillimonas granuli]MEB2398712.1 bifunctional 4-hydroxy-2-oxoglutarate aldolase/2-dehydro-3-deoxy-phosphogluconate aldolase [Alcaligenaceae bacterium]NYT48457.1 bifunctional 4-hydroxy-2-oxoglutarate aldolase/2-dehydro-3-deoxy-phosphogluconate aldolase [Parapusillimonas granuli]